MSKLFLIGFLEDLELKQLTDVNTFIWKSKPIFT